MLNLRPGPTGTGDEPSSIPGHDSASDSTAHLDRIPIDDEPGADAPGEDEAASGGPAQLTREQFRQGFNATFLVAGAATGLQTLSAAPQQPTAGPAADALYDIASESPWLRWLIQPQGVWLQRCAALAAFGMPVAAGVRAELLERQAAAEQAAAGG